MNFKMIVLTSVAALMMGACAHHGHHNCGSCSGKETTKECATKECPMDSKKKCSECEKSESAK
ncbi:hypothetical protein [Bdellovibrio sp.]|uniref:hypothetical protein n=1 Tax=Bdellovibrio sp. TaxID=28201 RepID=UPI0039E52476